MFPFPKPFWDGHTDPKVLRPELVLYRRRLFEGARKADWASVLELLAEDEYGTAVNSVGLADPSRFTLLHHAAAANAPSEVVAQLLSLGAFRSARCAVGKRPVDLAQRLGHVTLLPLLEPQPKYALGAQEQLSIQRHFHELILQEAMSPASDMRLPSLEVLLDQEDATMTFQVPFGVFVYRLRSLPFPISIDYDQTESILLVRSYQRMGEGIERHYVVTQHGSHLVSVNDPGAS